ncbi:hypothetical protein Leryth_013248 [Lithospermum erythrorhizon]|nr:hypothetical protein Leryth_013248 [Lithospermum erythrorhizon]
MSRICVKNLPKYAVEDRLKEFFSQKGQVTDAKLMRTTDGKSRQFGFVGFRTEEEAQDAIKFFNNSFFDTCRITCEIARKIGDQDLPRPWSKYSLKTQEKLSDKGKEVNDKKGFSVAGPKGQEKKSKTNGETDDPLLLEFLEVMKPHSTSKLWGNDTIAAASLEKSNTASNRNIKTRIGEDKSNVANAKSVVYDEEGDLLLGSNKEKPQSAAHDTGVSDVDYLKSRIKEKWSDSDSDEDENNGSQNDDNDSSDDDSESESDEVIDVRSVREQDSSGAKTKGLSKDIVDKLSGAGDLLPSSKGDMNGFDKIVRLFIRNLPYTATEEELEEHFSKFGDISEVHIVVDKETKRSKGIGYIRFSLPESAERALEELDNSIFQGRLLHVMPANEKTSEKQEMNALVNGASKSFKRQREEERKEAETSGNTQAWNPFYMRPDTVVENIARKFGMSKSDFLDKKLKILLCVLHWGRLK